MTKDSFHNNNTWQLTKESRIEIIHALQEARFSWQSYLQRDTTKIAKEYREILEARIIKLQDLINLFTI